MKIIAKNNNLYVIEGDNKSKVELIAFGEYSEKYDIDKEGNKLPGIRLFEDITITEVRACANDENGLKELIGEEKYNELKRE